MLRKHLRGLRILFVIEDDVRSPAKTTLSPGMLPIFLRLEAVAVTGTINSRENNNRTEPNVFQMVTLSPPC